VIIAILKGVGVSAGLLGISALLAWASYERPWIMGVILFVVVAAVFTYKFL
jgi:hypothetical protein